MWNHQKTPKSIQKQRCLGSHEIASSGKSHFPSNQLEHIQRHLGRLEAFCSRETSTEKKKDKPGFPTKCQCLVFSPNRFKLHTDRCYVTIPNNEFLVLRCIYILLLFFTVMNMNKEKRKKQFLTNIHVSLKFSDYNWLYLWSVVCFWMSWNDVMQGVHIQNIPNADVKKSLQKGMLILDLLQNAFCIS